MFSKLVISILLFATTSLAATQYSLTGDYRSYPRGVGLTADYNYSQMISGEKQLPTDWKYSFFRLGGKAAAHGLAEVYADYFPISIFQLGVAQSLVSRFYDSDQIDCEVLQCRGNLTRTTLKANLVLGYENIFSVIGLGQTNLSFSESDVAYAIEGETLIAGPNQDLLKYSQLFIGYKQEDSIYGFYTRGAHIVGTTQDSIASYFVFRKKWDENWGGMLGVGMFKSDEADESASAFIGASYSAGETLSIF